MATRESVTSILHNDVTIRLIMNTKSNTRKTIPTTCDAPTLRNYEEIT